MKKKFLIATLKCIAFLPLPVLYLVSDFIYAVVFHVVGYRRKVVRKNLEESFPEKSTAEIKGIEKEFYRFLCDVIVETVKLFNISDTQLAKRVEVKNASIVNQSLDRGTSVVLLLGHYGNWEWVQEITRYFSKNAFQVSIYHPMSNKLWDSVFQHLRSRWHAHIVPMKKAVRTLLDRNNFPWVCGFIADHRPYQFTEKNSVEFLNHKTFFIYNPEEIGKKVGADFFYLEMTRPKRGYYRITFKKLHPLSDNLPYPYTRSFWQAFEKTIRLNPQFWMWSHKRWKQ